MTDATDAPGSLGDTEAEEPWHGLMFLSTLITGVFGIVAITNGNPGSIMLGVLIFLLITAAGWLSRFWTIVDRLDNLPKAVIWIAAIPGGAFAATFLWMCSFINKIVSRR